MLIFDTKCHIVIITMYQERGIWPMSLEISLNLKGIKNIQAFSFDFNFESEIYALVGSNSVGKSTIMAALASTVYPKALTKYSNTEMSDSSLITITCKNKKVEWIFDELNGVHSTTRGMLFDGIYEGSIFSGTRFEDMMSIDNMLTNSEFTDSFVKAPTELMEALGYILRGDSYYYKELYKVKNMKIAKKFRLINMPYFLKLSSGKYISKFKMSSGECMLISLLHFIITNTYSILLLG